MMEKFINTFKSIASNQRGLTYMEIMVSLFVVGITSVGVMKLSDNASNQSVFIRQNFQLDSYAKNLRTYLEDKNQCNDTVSGSGTTINIDLTKFHTEKYPELETDLAGLKFDKTDVFLPTLSEGILPIDIVVYFDRTNDELKNIKAARKISLPVAFDASGSFVGCSSFDEEAEKAAYKISCEMLEGNYSYDQASGNMDCSFAAIDESNQLIQDIRQKACNELLGSDSFNSSNGVCNQINLPNIEITASNFGPGKLTVGGGTITSFSNQLCNENEFVTKINADGSVECTKVNPTYCRPCDANCDPGNIKNTLCIGATSAVTEVTGPCDVNIDPATVCKDTLLVPGFEICGYGTLDDSTCAADVCADAPDPSSVCAGIALVPGEDCGVGEMVNISCNTCWNTVSEVNYGAADNPDYSTSGDGWTCDTSSITPPADYTSTTGACTIGDSCTYNTQHDKKQYVCQSAVSACQSATPITTTEDPVVSEVEYRIDCGGSTYSAGVSENGQQCGSPHGNSCSAEDVGKTFGSASCTEVALAYGNPEQNHGDVRTESCTCISCEDKAQQTYLNGSGYSDFACAGASRGNSTTPDPIFTCADGSASYLSLSACQSNHGSCESSGFNADGSTCSNSCSSYNRILTEESIKGKGASLPPFCDGSSSTVKGKTISKPAVICSSKGEVENASSYGQCKIQTATGIPKRPYETTVYKVGCECATGSSCAVTRYCASSTGGTSTGGVPIDNKEELRTQR